MILRVLMDLRFQIFEKMVLKKGLQSTQLIFALIRFNGKFVFIAKQNSFLLKMWRN